MRETSLYPAVKRFLEAQGYEVKGEIAGCDVVGIKPGAPARLVIAEMKLGLNLELLLQGVERMGRADEVWLAVLATRRGRDRDARARKLCRLLGFGLLAVGPRETVDILAEPAPYQPRRDARGRRRITTEHQARQGDPSPGGTGGIKVMTAYRQEALRCVARLGDGPLRPRDLRPDAPRAATILYRDVYGWFERLGRGLYGLSPAGRLALDRNDESPTPSPNSAGDPADVAPNDALPDGRTRWRA